MITLFFLNAFPQITSLAKAVRTIAEMDEPIGQILKKTEVHWLWKGSFVFRSTLINRDKH